MMPPTTSRRARFSLLASLGALVTVGLSLGTTPPVRRVPSVTPAAGQRSDEELRSAVLGRWRTESNGTRIVDNRPDGTASMDVTFDFVASLLYGESMTLELDWFVKDGVLVYQITSGAPDQTVKSIIGTYGRQASYHFQSIEPRRMRLVRVIDPTETYLWTRID